MQAHNLAYHISHVAHQASSFAQMSGLRLLEVLVLCCGTTFSAIGDRYLPTCRQFRGRGDKITLSSTNSTRPAQPRGHNTQHQSALKFLSRSSRYRRSCIACGFHSLWSAKSCPKQVIANFLQLSFHVFCWILSGAVADRPTKKELCETRVRF